MVEQWCRNWREGGLEGLQSKGPAKLPKLSDERFAVLEEELAKGPAAHGWEDQRWTLERVRTLIGWKIERTEEFLDLVGACHRFVSACGKTVPQLRDRHLSDDERAVLAQNVARCRAVLDWVETAAETGEVDMDEELARILRGE